MSNDQAHPVSLLKLGDYIGRQGRDTILKVLKVDRDGQRFQAQAIGAPAGKVFELRRTTKRGQVRDLHLDNFTRIEGAVVMSCARDRITFDLRTASVRVENEEAADAD